MNSLAEDMIESLKPWVRVGVRELCKLAIEFNPCITQIIPNIGDDNFSNHTDPIKAFESMFPKYPYTHEQYEEQLKNKIEADRKKLMNLQNDMKNMSRTDEQKAWDESVAHPWKEKAVAQLAYQMHGEASQVNDESSEVKELSQAKEEWTWWN